MKTHNGSYLPKELLCVVLSVAMEDRDEAPDCVEDSVRRHQRPLSRPHHTHQGMHLSRQTAAAREKIKSAVCTWGNPYNLSTITAITIMGNSYNIYTAY